MEMYSAQKSEGKGTTAHRRMFTQVSSQQRIQPRFKSGTALVLEQVYLCASVRLTSKFCHLNKSTTELIEILRVNIKNDDIHVGLHKQS